MTNTPFQILLILLLVAIIVLLSVCLYFQKREATVMASSEESFDASSDVTDMIPPTDAPQSTPTQASTDPANSTTPPATDAPGTSANTDATMTKTPSSETQPETQAPPVTEKPPVTTEPPATTEAPPVTTPPVTAPPVTTEPPATTETTQEPPPVDPNAPLICIDPGHGFEDPGAIGTLNGQRYHEADINLAIALKLKSALEARGFRVILTHDGVNRPQGYLDTATPHYNVNRRYDWILDQNKNGAGIDAVISIHCDSAGSSASGTRYYIDNTEIKDQSESHRLLAALMQAQMKNMPTEPTPREFQQTLRVLQTPLPSVLVECGFISTPSDLAKLLDDAWQTALANSLADGVVSYFARPA